MSFQSQLTADSSAGNLAILVVADLDYLDTAVEVALGTVVVVDDSQTADRSWG